MGHRKSSACFASSSSICRGSLVINVRNVSLTLIRSGSGLCSDVSAQLIHQPEWLIWRCSNAVLQCGLIVISCVHGPWHVICRPAKPRSSCRASELCGSLLHFLNFPLEIYYQSCQQKVVWNIKTILSLENRDPWKAIAMQDLRSFPVRERGLRLDVLPQVRQKRRAGELNWFDGTDLSWIKFKMDIYLCACLLGKMESVLKGTLGGCACRPPAVLICSASSRLLHPRVLESECQLI